MYFKLLDTNHTYIIIDKLKLDQFLRNSTTLYKKVLEEKDYDSDFKALFLKKGDVFLIDFGEKITFKTDDSIYTEFETNSILYSANIDGYLGFKDNKLGILSPYHTREDLLEEYLIYLPVKSNFESIKKLIEDSSVDCFDKPFKILITKGFAAIPPVNASIEWHIANMSHPPLLDNGKIDYRSYSKYIEVEKNCIIAEKTLMIPGVPGKNVFNEIIDIPEAKDIEIKLGDNVLCKKEDGKELYIAAETGILDLTPKSISISTIFKINSDISYETGNINFSGDIEINGNIKPKFKVNCGGNLKLNGSVENGGVINCEGSVVISKGIIGFDTKLNIKKDLKVEFLQDCNIRIDGNMTILNSIYNSNVFSKGFITVLGQQLHGNSHGSVVGGSIVAMKGMELHSVGSISSQSKLVAGIDLDLLEEISRLEEVLPLINIKVIKLQKHLNLDITDNNQDLSYLSKVEKEILKKQLLEIKELIIKKEKIQSIINKLQKEYIEEDLSPVKVTIDNFIIEGTTIAIGEYNLKIEEDDFKSTYSLDNSRIKKNSN